MNSFSVIIIVVVLISGIVLHRINLKKKIRNALVRRWGKPISRKRNFEQIGLYHHLLSTREKDVRVIDDSSWLDLDMNELFTKMDRTSSGVGRQFLYAMLHRPLWDIRQLQRRDDIIHFFVKHPKHRVDFQVLLEALSLDRDMYIPYLFLKELPTIGLSKWFTLLPAAALFLSVINGFLVSPSFFAATPIIFLVNMMLGGKFHQRYRDHLQSVFSLRKLFNVLQKMIPIFPVDKYPFQSSFQAGQKSLKRLKPLRRLLAALPAPQVNPDSMAGWAQDILNQIFLLELILYTFAADRIRKGMPDIHTVYKVVGEFDALLAVASYQRSLKPKSTPDFIPGNNKINYQKLCHPLLTKPVPNDFSLSEESALITGSNMSGKSTFLKALGVNQLLAQTLYFCHAEHAELRFAHIITSMRRDDDIVHGKSFYYKEVERVKLLLDSVQNDTPLLILLDEIFRGTNTVERIAASCEVLRYLNTPKSMVCAATHDIELAELLKVEYVFFHFREEIIDHALNFDYTIRPGVTSTRNAIAILELMDYPEQIVRNAYQLSKSLE